MMRRLKSKATLNVAFAVLAAGAAFTPVATAQTPAPRYVVVDLGPADAGINGYGFEINAAGVAAGLLGDSSRPPNGEGRPALLRRDQAPVALSELEGQPYAINLAEEVVGVVSSGNDVVGFFWKNGVLSLVPSPAGYQTRLFGINDASIAVGHTYRTSDAHVTAVRYQDGVVTDLGTWGGTSASAVAINNAGTIAGYRTRARLRYSVIQGVLVDAGGGISLVNVFRAKYVMPYGLNASGDVVGQYSSGGPYLGFARVGNRAHSVALPGATQAWCAGINDHGHAVCESDSSEGPTLHALVWQRGRVLDLNTLPEVAQAGWTLLYNANAINNDGVIVGSGLRQTGESHAYMLVPR